MSVKVNALTKEYGTQKAVNAVSFEAKKGEILGFLGPNGAGKTTTMKILTCYIPQTSGSAEVCGYDVAKHPFEVRQRIGYLPEHNPVYKDLYVKEYLMFVAGLHHLPNAICIVRIVLIVPIVMLMLAGDYQLALGLVMVAGASDALDGWLAKHFGWSCCLFQSE